jgi:hypothetical protein
MTGGAAMSGRDWTADEHGRSNASPLFEEMCAVVERIIRDGAPFLIAGRAEVVAGEIMARLAHVHGLAPAPKPAKKRAS